MGERQTPRLRGAGCDCGGCAESGDVGAVCAGVGGVWTWGPGDGVFVDCGGGGGWGVSVRRMGKGGGGDGEGGSGGRREEEGGGVVEISLEGGFVSRRRGLRGAGRGYPAIGSVFFLNVTVLLGFFFLRT